MKRFAIIAALILLATPAQADPLSIAVLGALGYSAGGLLAPTAVLLSLAGNALVAALPAILLNVALIGGATLLANAFRPAGPKPSDRQATVRQSVGPRWRFYGRVKVGGTLWFFESVNGVLFTGVTLNEGQISGVQEVWLNDLQVALDVNGYVTTPPYPTEIVRFLFRYGTPTQTAIPELVGAFPGVVTNDHRLGGIAYYLSSFREVSREDIPKIYPQGNPNVRIVMDASVVKLVGSSTRAWSENPADIIYDYLTAVDGAGFAYGAGFPESRIDTASFVAFRDLCDELVPKKDGGTLKRYVGWGGYALNEQMRAVLDRLLACCDGELFLTGEGKVAIRGGQWTEPVLTLDSDLGHIISADFRQGQSALAAFNELTIVYTDPAQDYQETEGERWLDVSNIALRGQVLSQQLDLYMVPYHAQARRLGKIATAKGNPKWIGNITTNLYGFNALNERLIRVKFGPLGIDETFLVNSVKMLDTLTGVQIAVTSLSESAYGWDAELEEGSGPGDPPDTSSAVDLPPPEGIAVSVETVTVNGETVGLHLVVTWDPPERTALIIQVQYRESPSGAWLNMSVSQEDARAESGIVNEGTDYDVQVRTLSPGGVPGPWSSIVTVTAEAP